MNAPSLLANLRAAGVSICAEDGDLVVEAQSGKVSTDVRAALGQNKAELLLLLAAPAEPADPETAVRIRARKLLNGTGVRIMILNGVSSIGVWSDLDEPEIRESLRSLGHELTPVRYLDGTGIPMQYKLREVKGEPVPMAVLIEMERKPAAPCTVRERLICSPEGVGWHRWKAAAVNRLFEAQGVTGQPGRITAETIKHGEKKETHRRAESL